MLLENTFNFGQTVYGTSTSTDMQQSEVTTLSGT